MMKASKGIGAPSTFEEDDEVFKENKSISEEHYFHAPRLSPKFSPLPSYRSGRVRQISLRQKECTPSDRVQNATLSLHAKILDNENEQVNV